MATPPGRHSPAATPPADTFEGPGHTVLLVMSDLGPEPATGRLLRGLTPYLDEQKAENVFLLTERKRREPWRGHDHYVAYQELVYWRRGEDGGVYQGVSGPAGALTVDQVKERFQSDPLNLLSWAAELVGAAIVSTDAPMFLEVLHVPKPWGREGWYTGIEQRGVSRVRSATGATDLPYALGMFPVPLLGANQREVILLKTLEPKAAPVVGDLYLEVHKEKWETYLVMEVDRTAWPKGVGYLRAGLGQDALNEFQKEHGAAAPDAVVEELGRRIAAYEVIRREIDERLNGGSGAKKGEVRGPTEAQLRKEERLRKRVEALLGNHPMAVGDVAVLPPGVLHSLRHGVKVVEFQTPTYERLIAMFAQQVQTQSHWDTEAALALMERGPYVPPATTVLAAPAPEVEADLVVDFPQFQVRRYRMALGAAFEEREAAHATYRLLFVVAGGGRLEFDHGRQREVAQGEACLLPAAMRRLTIHATDEAGLTVLVASPAEGESK